MAKVLITGAGGALGKACVTGFLEEGHDIIAILSPGKELPYPTRSPISVYNADITDEMATRKVLEQVLEAHGPINIALLLVGGFAMGTIDTADGAGIREMIRLNFETAFYTARPIFAHMMAQPNGGRIAFVGARPALDAKAGKGVVAYALSKTLVFKLAELLNEEGKEKNVVSSVIVPSIIDTPSNRKAMPKANTHHWVSPEAIAGIIRFATSEKGAAMREPIIKAYGNS
ncbi:MAG: SDR family NAD(P)-dependent oxidoreductase [Cyclobacteriaceae bacterium]|nr:SDR family NAD(P)-dependent oxidoreductase [Cyclobacteriaceae bacterium]MCB0500619.1 SDR family NAD(P)-dependent oxidoreductase [Cyclobacteriaceae bacterium]MCB9236332.1 SDR family NAD(P)-dependent oxidoreductase [Flammeovirgaceae bacterium]MCO5272733.1 SDR family NAD(P)-dependent oxidoreductase [Cyclobacteriaceae bacterium]MCW5902172.1 SDR family NAD(P)-dependent oxidoreductase [Cyclobacteriaceae bacterium]